MSNLPYAQVPGSLEKMLEKIKTASVPEKFSSDFVSTKLSMRGGQADLLSLLLRKWGLPVQTGLRQKGIKNFVIPLNLDKLSLNA